MCSNGTQTRSYSRMSASFIDIAVLADWVEEHSKNHDEWSAVLHCPSTIAAQNDQPSSIAGTIRPENETKERRIMWFLFLYAQRITVWFVYVYSKCNRNQWMFKCGNSAVTLASKITCAKNNENSIQYIRWNHFLFIFFSIFWWLQTWAIHPSSRHHMSADIFRVLSIGSDVIQKYIYIYMLCIALRFACCCRGPISSQHKSPACGVCIICPLFVRRFLSLIIIMKYIWLLLIYSVFFKSTQNINMPHMHTSNNISNIITFILSRVAALTQPSPAIAMRNALVKITNIAKTHLNHDLDADMLAGRFLLFFFSFFVFVFFCFVFLQSRWSFWCWCSVRGSTMNERPNCREFHWITEMLITRIWHMEFGQ